MVNPPREHGNQWYGIPLNFVDKKTGQVLKPVLKFQDALGVWHEKPLADCNWQELYNYATAVWNVAMFLQYKKQPIPQWAWATLSLILFIYCVYAAFR